MCSAPRCSHLPDEIVTMRKLNNACKVVAQSMAHRAQYKVAVIINNNSSTSNNNKNGYLYGNSYLLRGFFYSTHLQGAKYSARLRDSTIEQEMHDCRMHKVSKQTLESGCLLSSPNFAISNCMAMGNDSSSHASVFPTVKQR